MLRPVRRSFVASARGFPGIAVVAIASLLAGCLGGVADSGKLHEQAEAALARWADAVAAAGGAPQVVIVGDLTGQVGDWESAVGDNNKLALYAGLVVAEADLPSEVPPDGEVLWSSGPGATVPLLSAQQAVAAIRAGSTGPCDDCAPLRLTAARLTAGPVQTSRGPATAPVWAFTVRDTAVEVTRVAIAEPIVVEPPPWDPDDAPIGLAIDSASGTLGGRELTVTFIGAPLPATKSAARTTRRRLSSPTWRSSSS